MSSKSTPRRPGGGAPWVCVGVFLGVCLASTCVSLILYLRFGTSMDLAIFYQGLANLAGHYPAGVSIKSPGAELFGDHFHPIVLVAVPVVRCWNSPVALLILQAAAVAAAVTIITREHLRVAGRLDRVWLWGLATSPALWGALSYDFHEVALGSPLVAWTCIALMRRRWSVATLLAGACMVIKEDMGALILPCAVVLWWAGARLRAASLAAWVLMWTWVVTTRVIPAFNPQHAYTYGRPGLLTAAPAAWVHSLVVPGLLTMTLLTLAAGVAFRFPRRWLLLPALGNVAYRASVDNFRYWIPGYHYWLLPFLFIALASVDGRPLAGWRRRVATATAALATLVGPTTFALASTAGVDTAAVTDAIAVIPAGSHVATDPRFAARLSTSNVVSLVDRAHPVLSDGVTWVLLDERTSSYGGPGWVRPLVAQLTPEFDVVAGTRAGLVVLRRRTPTGRDHACSTSDAGTLCVQARALAYDVTFTPNRGVADGTLDLNLVCRDGVWLGLSGPLTQTGSELGHSFVVGRTTHDACRAALLVAGVQVLTTPEVRAF